MCFEPAVSLGTAIFEFALVAVLLALFKTKMARFQAVFIFILGFYQFTEYMVCTSGNAALFATLGFAAYTFLPAIGMHFFLSYTKRKFPMVLLYVVPSIFAVIALLAKPFVVETSCGIFTVLVRTILFPGYLSIPYFAYYFGYIAAGLLLIHRESRKRERLMTITFYLAVLLTVLPPVILLAVLPSTGIVFPSVFCQFAVFYAIFAMIAVYLEKKNKKQK